MERDVLVGRCGQYEVLGLRVTALAGRVLAPVLEVLGHGVDGDGADRLHQRGLDVLRAATVVPPYERGDDAGDRRQSGDQVGHAGARKACRSGVAQYGDDTAVGLADGARVRQERGGAAAAEAGDRRVDEVGPERQEVVWPEAEGVHL